MDIAAMSMALAQSKTANAVGASVMNLTKDVMQQQGLALQQLMATNGSQAAAMERSVTPHIGGHIDLKL